MNLENTKQLLNDWQAGYTLGQLEVKYKDYTRHHIFALTIKSTNNIPVEKLHNILPEVTCDMTGAEIRNLVETLL